MALTLLTFGAGEEEEAVADILCCSPVWEQPLITSGRPMARTAVQWAFLGSSIKSLRVELEMGADL
jgi:hypothetical protein